MGLKQRPKGKSGPPSVLVPRTRNLSRIRKTARSVADGATRVSDVRTTLGVSDQLTRDAIHAAHTLGLVENSTGVQGVFIGTRATIADPFISFEAVPNVMLKDEQLDATWNADETKMYIAIGYTGGPYNIGVSTFE